MTVPALNFKLDKDVNYKKFYEVSERKEEFEKIWKERENDLKEQIKKFKDIWKPKKKNDYKYSFIPKCLKVSC